jgi:hypothetical protein
MNGQTEMLNTRKTMKNQSNLNTWRHSMCSRALGALVGLSCLTAAFGAGVPVRLSFKFILNSAGNRPATGAINTDAAVNAQVQRADQIWSSLISELRVDNLEIVNISGASQWYTATNGNRDALRSAAMSDPTTYHWRSDAVNVYITAGDDSAVSDFPPNNNIILVCQGISDTTIAHEVGHILSLRHTHDPDGDYCSDTIMDNKDWTQDDIASNNFGAPYASLSDTQKAQVDQVWWNVMSYHNTDARYVLTSCQMARQSRQSYANESWILSKSPVYVDATYGGSQNGSFDQPYQTIQQAVNARVLNGRVMVLESGGHPRPNSPLNIPVDIATRRASSTIQEAPPAFSLPYTLEESKNPRVREAVILAQQSDRRGDIAAVIVHLQEAEKQASGREKTALQLQLAQRFSDAGRYQDASAYFKKTAQATDQEELRKHAFKRAEEIEKKAAHAEKGKEHVK